MDRSVARARFAQQKAGAKKRGIEWDMTFEEWCKIWEPHWEKRGQHRDGRVMCRAHDQGAYRVDNVRIDTPKSNAAEAALMRRCASPQWGARVSVDRSSVTEGIGLHSDGSRFLRPDKALELEQEEYEWIPGE